MDECFQCVQAPVRKPNQDEGTVIEIRLAKREDRDRVTVIEIRLAKREDRDRVTAIDSRVADGDLLRSDDISGWISGQALWLAEHDDTIAGYYVLQRSFFGQWFVEMLMVGTKHRRKGVASQLLKHAREQCGEAKLFSSTNESNAPMRAVFAHLGWEHCGRIEGLDDGDPELIYRVPDGVYRHAHDE